MGCLSVNSYRAWLVEHPAHASADLMYPRFGSWREACRLAGVRPGVTGRVYLRTYDEDACLQALARFLTSGAPRASVVAYQGWCAGQVGTPSEALIRRRFGTWAKARALALHRLAHPARSAA